MGGHRYDHASITISIVFNGVVWNCFEIWLDGLSSQGPFYGFDYFYVCEA